MGGLMTCGRNSTAGMRAKMPASLWRGRVSANKMSRVATSTTTLLRLHRRPQRAPGWPDLGGCPISRRGLRHVGGSSPRGDLAI
jgi:hypothetical protein